MPLIWCSFNVESSIIREFVLSRLLVVPLDILMLAVVLSVRCEMILPRAFLFLARGE